jgi:histone deacetylase 8
MNPLEKDCPLFSGLRDYVQLVGGATLTAVSALQQNVGDIAICWDGGRHHARKDQASGFCYVADCILAILALKRYIPPSLPSSERDHQNIISRKPRIMYLDLDLHFSDAVSEAFYSPTSSIIPQILVSKCFLEDYIQK